MIVLVFSLFLVGTCRLHAPVESIQQYIRSSLAMLRSACGFVCVVCMLSCFKPL